MVTPADADRISGTVRYSTSATRQVSLWETSVSVTVILASWALVIVGALLSLLGAVHAIAITMAGLDRGTKAFAHVIGLLFYFLPGAAIGSYGVQQLRKRNR